MIFAAQLTNPQQSIPSTINKTVSLTPSLAYVILYPIMLVTIIFFVAIGESKA